MTRVFINRRLEYDLRTDCVGRQIGVSAFHKLSYEMKSNADPWFTGPMLYWLNWLSQQSVSIS